MNGKWDHSTKPSTYKLLDKDGKVFYIGNTISNLLYFEWMGIVLYPIYKKIMIWSSELDKDGVIWKNINNDK